jgi:hypothetical protein
MAILRQLCNYVTCLVRLDTIFAMWRKLHVLSPVQSLVLASASAAIIAVTLARHETALLHDLFWPDSLNPYMMFSLVFLGLVPVLLGYYHLGRLGFLLSVAVGFALAWVMAVCGIICFVGVGHYFGSIRLSTAAYATCVLLVYMLIARLHLKATKSQSVHDAQRKLRLVPAGTL